MTAATTHLCAPMLLVVVYTKCAYAPALMQYISTQWSMELDPNTGVYVKDQADCHMWSYEPPTAPDSTIVYLACDHTADAATGWAAMRNTVQALLNDGLFAPDQVIGYSVVYQAEFAEMPTALQPDAMVSAAQWDAIHATVKPLHRGEDSPPLPTIASDSVPGCGALWLMHVPSHHATGVAIGSVYLALSFPDSDNCLVQKVLFSNGPFVMSDLIAHKTYYQMREYQRDDGVHAYNARINTLRKSTTALLDAPKPDMLDSTDKFNELTKNYDQVTGDVLLLQAIHISLLQQQTNYPWWKRRFLEGNSTILDYHWERITTGVRDAELLTAKGKTVLETSSTTVQVLRTRLEQTAERDRQEQKEAEEQRREEQKEAEEQRRLEQKEAEEQRRLEQKEAEEQRQQRIAVVLAVFGIVLAIPQLVTWDVACGFLVFVGSIDQMACESGTALRPFWVQVGLVFILLFGVWLVWAMEQHRP